MAFHDCTLDIRSGDAGSFQMKIIEARQSLVRIRERKLPQFNPLREDIERSIAEIAELSDSFDGPEPTDVKKLTGWLRNHVDLVDKLNVKLSEA